MDVHLRRLRAFVIVAEELHFTRAATRLFVAQQALSKQIADLESELGTALLDRTSRKVELTSAGEVFLAMAQDVLARFDRGVEEARRVGAGGHTTLRVGFMVGAALELTPHIFSEFTNRYPEARLELHEFGLDDASSGLATGATDVAFVRLPSSTGELVITELFTEPCVVGVSVAHRLSERDQVRAGDLTSERIAIGRTEDPVWRDFWTLRQHESTTRSVESLVETTSQSEELEIVAAGMACTVTPAAAIRYLPHPGIRFIPIEDYPRSAVAVAHPAEPKNPWVTAFVDAATAVRDREVSITRSIEMPFGSE